MGDEHSFDLSMTPADSVEEHEHEHDAAYEMADLMGEFPEVWDEGTSLPGPSLLLLRRRSLRRRRRSLLLRRRPASEPRPAVLVM